MIDDAIEQSLRVSFSQVSAINNDLEFNSDDDTWLLFFIIN